MKKTPRPKPPVPSLTGIWRILAIVSLMLNAAMAVWLWRAARPAAAVRTSESVTPPVAATSTPAKRVNRASPYGALGSYMAENNRIPDLQWTEQQFAEFQEGFRASYEGRGLPLDEDARKLRDNISERVQQMLAVEQPNPLQEYFTTLREKEGVKRTSSDLHYRITEEGFGARPKADDSVLLSFAARLPDGRELSSLTRARVKMPVRDLLPGLAEAVQLLQEGGKALIYLPPPLAFTEENWPPQVPRGMPIGFFIELHGIELPSP